MKGWPRWIKALVLSTRGRPHLPEGSNPSPFDIIYDKIHAARDSIEGAYYKVKRLVEYVPIIWHGYDWDYGQILKMLRYNIVRTRTNIHLYGHGANDSELVDQMDEVIALLDKIIADDYSFEQSMEIRKRHRPDQDLLDFTPLPPEGEEELRIARNQGFIQREQDWGLLWDLLQKNLRSWWD